MLRKCKVDVVVQESVFYYNEITKIKEDFIMLKAGFARVDVTPPFGTPLAGYYEMRNADGVLDPIYLNAVALNDGENSILLITADVLLIRLVEADKMRKMISEKTGVAEDHILINSLHTHTCRNDYFKSNIIIYGKCPVIRGIFP